MQGSQSPLDFRLVWPVKELDGLVAEPGRRTAAVIVITSSAVFDSLFLAPGLITRLVSAGVEFFALVGTESEQAHDALDWVLEDFGAEDVVTTWHDWDDLEDVATLVVASSRASGVGRLIVVLDESTASGSKLKTHILDAILADATG